MHKVSFCRTSTHPFYLKKLKDIGYQSIKNISLHSKIKLKSGIKHQAFQIAGCHCHLHTSKDMYYQLNVKLFGFKYKAKPQHVSAKSSEPKAFSLLLLG